MSLVLDWFSVSSVIDQAFLNNEKFCVPSLTLSAAIYFALEFCGWLVMSEYIIWNCQYTICKKCYVMQLCISHCNPV